MREPLSHAAERVAAVVLAAGQGTRMKSSLPKVLHPVLGQPLVAYAVETALAVTGRPPVLVVGHGANDVRQTLGEAAEYALQAEQLGTGHAVLQARDALLGRVDRVLVWYADMPLISPTMLQRLLAQHVATDATFTIVTVIADDPRGFGRVVRGADGSVTAVVEEADCSPEQLAMRELNAGVYCFEAEWLWRNLPLLPVSRKGEYYLTDAVALAARQGYKVEAFVYDDPDELLGINTRVHLAEAEAAMRGRINRRWMEAGVTMIDPASITVEPQVEIGQDTVIEPGTLLRGRTVVGSQCQLGPHTIVENSVLGDRCSVIMSVVRNAAVTAGSRVGPFANIAGETAELR
jgi:bifunctional UDP-N-acetylglucosamine pyrophosphorylase / glucosamine-1-phosphate N-acetyltransferase